MKHLHYIEKNFNATVLQCDFIKNIIHSKFSVSHNEVREYNHYFYKVILKDYEIDGNYQFLSMDKIKENNRIMEVNFDIVKFIEDLNL